MVLCQHGHHKVDFIEMLDQTDQSDKFLIKEGYKWHGTCKVCGTKRIVAKDKKEYSQFGYEPNE